MIKTILLAVAGDEGDAAAFAAALSLARPSSAHLDVLHVRVDAVNAGVAMTTDGGAGVATAGLIERLEQDAGEREARARALFTQLCATAKLVEAAAPAAGSKGPTAQFHVETGDEARWIAAYGTAADLIVTCRAGAPRSTLEAALFDSGRPIVIPAAAALPEKLDRIAVAWKPTPQAARAVASAMPFLTRAKEVRVITVEEGGEAGQDADRLLRNFAWHGITATAERVALGPDGPAATLLAAIAGRADLLVMGGYGHSRLREWVFGGFTEHVLRDAPLPVLIAH